MIQLAANELVIDYFAGGGGASSGIEEAIGRPIDIAINHDPEAVAMHAANHPLTKHYCKDIWEADPLEVTQGRPVGLGWFSPDCKHFSRAKGGKPVSKRVRGLAWVVIRWAKAVRPRVIMLENVSEFATWGPLLEDGSPCKIRKGFTFRRWCKMLQNLGYELDMRELVAAKYGAGTTRKRLYIIARCDGQPIVWPEETHGPGLLPYVTAADCIDWSIPCPSIFERSKPLADATLRRIARGITRYVVNNPKPFIVQMRGTEDSQINGSARPVGEPLGTVSAGGIHHALITPIIAGVGGRMGQSAERTVDRPLQTVTTKADSVLVTPVIMPLTHQGDRRAHPASEPLPTITGAHRGELALISPTLINTRNGEREGQAPRVHDILKPAPTVTAKGSQGALVAAFLARHYGGHENDGAPMTRPMHTITTQDHHHLVKVKLEPDESDRSSVDPDSSRSDPSASGRDSLEIEKPSLTSGDSAPAGDSRQARLFAGESLHEQPPVCDGRSPTGLDCSQGADPAGLGAEPRGRQQGQQSSGQSEIDDSRPEYRTRMADRSAQEIRDAQEIRSGGEAIEGAGTGICGDRSEARDIPDDCIQGHAHEVAAFLLSYYGTDQNPKIDGPLGTVTTKDRFGLVTVMGDKYYIADIGMRMLVPRELFNAQSFRRDYIIDPIVNGKPMTKTAQVRMAGNSVCRVMSKALVGSNFLRQPLAEAA